MNHPRHITPRSALFLVAGVSGLDPRTVRAALDGRAHFVTTDRVREVIAELGLGDVLAPHPAEPKP